MDRELSIQLNWLSQQPSCLQGMKRGLEKESLRIDADGWLAQTPHLAALGSALMHPSITTDYSEALLELITPPCDSIASAFGYLDEVHAYVYSQLGSERLWVNSMPCKLGPDAQIPLAQYGSSNIGRMKTLYRHGLGLRYGRRMQTIAGIHYNLSFPDSFWQAWQETSGNTQSLTEFRSEKSFALIRNFQRRSWLLLYLLGASPAVCGTFLEGRQHGLDAMASGTLYRPHATSLRMSSLGYQNDAQSDLKVSYNALDKYVRDLDRAIRTPYPPYQTMGVKQDGVYQQLNGHILQIENEYYGLIRPKRNSASGERPTQALARAGVEYVELRCVDLDPFEPFGISRDSAHFLEVFALHCVLSDSPLFSDADYQRLPLNQQAMVECGRDPTLMLDTGTEAKRFRELAAQLFAELRPVADILDSTHATSAYSAAVAVQIAKLQEPALTGSAMVLRALDEWDGCFYQFAMDRAERVRMYYQQRPLAEERAQTFRDEATASLQRQADLEARPAPVFDEFLQQYFADAATGAA
jgi:glutamate--cysteine ligase